MKRKSASLLKSTMCLTLGIQLLFALGIPAQSQPAPFVVLSESGLNDHALYDAWVEFKDKDIQTKKQRRRILKNLQKNFCSKALARRKKKRTFPGLFDERDFPLASKYLEGVVKTGAEIRVKSRWINGVSILATKKQIEKIKNLPYVKDVTDFHEHKPRKQLKTPLRSSRKRPEDISGFYGRSEVQVRQLGLDKLHKAGYTGRGIVIAVIDCGFDLSHTAFRNPKNPIRVIAQWDFVENDGDITPRPGIHPTNYDHGTYVLGILASYAPKELVGTAYEADYILCNPEDGEAEYYLEERWFIAALEFAESRGADVATSSLVLYGGYSQDQIDGKTSVMTRGMNIAVGNGVICLAGCGNYGHDLDPSTSHLMAPGDAIDVISVGAINHEGTIASFSSDGPTFDGRLKPEVLAMGIGTSTVSLVDKKSYLKAFGTSVATPIMAGAVACLLQVHPEWTVQKLRKALFHSGNFYRQHGKPDQLFIHGYGIPDVFLAAGLK